MRALTRDPRRLNPGAEAVKGDLTDARAACAVLEGVDVLVHLAAHGVRSREREWAAELRTNVLGSFGLLEAATSRVRRHSVLVSTSLEYEGHGRLPGEPCDDVAARCDEDSSLRPATSYGATKAAAGILLRMLARERGHDCWYLRLAGIYGPADDAGKLLPAAARAARKRECFETTSGLQVRDWLWIGDAVRALLLATETAPPAGGVTCNVGTGQGVAQAALVREIFRVSGADDGLIRWGAVPYRRDEPHVLVTNPDRARMLLGFEARVGTTDGIARLMAAKEGASR